MSDLQSATASAPSGDDLVQAFWKIPAGLYTTQTLLGRVEQRLRAEGRQVWLEQVTDLRRLTGDDARAALAILNASDLQQPTDPSAAPRALRTGT